MPKNIAREHFDADRWEVIISNVDGGITHYKTEKRARLAAETLGKRWNPQMYKITVQKCTGGYAKCYHGQGNRMIR